MKELKLEVVEKTTLAKAIARKMCLTILDAMKIIDTFEEEIIESIKNNKKVQLNGFLIFTPKNVEGKTIISPLDHKEYKIEPKRTVEVRVGKYFKDTIKDSYKPERKEDENDSNKEQKRTNKSKKQNK